MITVLQKPTAYERADWCIMGIKGRAGSWRISIWTSALSSTALSWLISTKCTCVLVCLHAQVTLGSAVCLMWRRVVAQHSAGVWFSWPIQSPDFSLSCDLSSFASLSSSFSPDSGLDLCWRAVQRFRVLWWQLLWKGQRDFSVGYSIRYKRPHMKPITDLALSNRKITDKIINLVLNYWWAAGIWFILVQAGSCQIL